MAIKVIDTETILKRFKYRSDAKIWERLEMEIKNLVKLTNNNPCEYIVKQYEYVEN